MSELESIALRLAAWAGLGGWVVRQLLQTLANRPRWPWVPQNMFAHDLADPVRRLVVALWDSHGNHVLVEPGNVLPVEFFRAQRMLLQVFAPESDDQHKDEFAQRLLARLNDRPWRAWDEVDASARARPGTRFVGFDLALAEFEFERRRSIHERPQPSGASVFYSCRFPPPLES